MKENNSLTIPQSQSFRQIYFPELPYHSAYPLNIIIIRDFKMSFAQTGTEIVFRINLPHSKLISNFNQIFRVSPINSVNITSRETILML